MYGKILENAAEELEVRELYGVDANEVAKFNDNILVFWSVAWTEHVSILLRGQERGH